METESYLREKGFEFKRSRDQFCLKICPLCGDQKYHFYISEDGAWICHKCQGKGNLYQLKKHLGDATNKNHGVRSANEVMGKGDEVTPLDIGEYTKCHEALLANPGAMRYLTQERCFSEEAIKHFKLGISKENDGSWLAIPHFKNGEIVNIKFRTFPPREKKLKEYQTNHQFFLTRILSKMDSGKSFFVNPNLTQYHYGHTSKTC